MSSSTRSLAGLARFLMPYRARIAAAAAALVVAAGCVLPMETPDANVAAVIRRLGGPLKPVPGATSR